MSKPSPETTSDLMDAMAQLKRQQDEIMLLRKALVPFANAARSSVVQDALSFGRDAPKLTLSRGFDGVLIEAQAFARALELS